MKKGKGVKGVGENKLIGVRRYLVGRLGGSGRTSAGHTSVVSLTALGLLLSACTSLEGLINGDKVLEGGKGDDVLFGGAGNDKISGGDGNDELQGRAGNDTLNGNKGNDKLFGEEGDDTLFGNEGDDTLVGDADDDTLFGNEGDDTLAGREGNDKLYGGIGKDKLYGGIGKDTLDGGEGDDLVSGNEGNDTLQGGIGSDVLYGGIGNDTLDGGEGNDLIYGDEGDDTLNGNEGNDFFYDGEGNDAYVFNLNETGLNTITDKAGTGDSIELKNASSASDVNLVSNGITLKITYEGNTDWSVTINSWSTATNKIETLVIGSTTYDLDGYSFTKDTPITADSLTEESTVSHENDSALVGLSHSDTADF